MISLPVEFAIFHIFYIGVDPPVYRTNIRFLMACINGPTGPDQRGSGHRPFPAVLRAGPFSVQWRVTDPQGH